MKLNIKIQINGGNNMAEIILGIIAFFILTYFAVWLAIRPLLNKINEIHPYDNKVELIKLRDIGIFNDAELEEVIKLFQNRNASKEDYEQYIKHVKILNELNKMGYYNDEERSQRLNKLKEHYRID